MTVIVVLLGIAGALLVFNLSSVRPRLDKPLNPDYDVGDPMFMRIVGNLLGPPFTEGNSVKAFHNGDEFYRPMLEAIRRAEYTINMETYVYWTGSIADEFAETLAERARSGVQVRVLLDFIGCLRMERRLIDLMREAGAEVEYFRPLKWYNLDRVNNRSHRKLLIIDGKVGFTGGAGIADEWLGNAQDEDHWRDNHFELRGPVVAQLQAGFAEHWLKANSELIQGPRFFPELHPAGSILAQAFNSSAIGGSDKMRSLYLLSIAAAKDSIRIGTPYFVPDSFLLENLIQASHRGVKVEVLTTGKGSDSLVAEGASRSFWGELLSAGIKLYSFEPTLYHVKVLIVDDKWSSIGSTNFDNRSFLHNDENNVNILDTDFAAELLQQFETDKQRSTEITLEMWRKRPLKEKVLEWWTTALKSQA